MRITLSGPEFANVSPISWATHSALLHGILSRYIWWQAYKVVLSEDGWDVLQGGVPTPATRDEFLTALADIEDILIRATIADTTEQSVLK